MLSNNIWCVIMAGGAGTRIWPISTYNVPKQFIGIEGSDENFIQATVRRIGDLVPPERTIVVTNRRLETLTRESLPQIPEQNILLEPYKRDTAPCVAYAMYTILKRDPNAIMIVLPSDQIIVGDEKFRQALAGAVEYVRDNDVLMSIGIHPTRPDTNYGYIQGESMPQTGQPVAVKTFTEKPDRELADVFVHSGEFLWNSGIFVWKADTIRQELERYLPQLPAQFSGWQGAMDSEFRDDFVEKAFAECQKISIDIAVMEKTAHAWVYPADFGWFDIGTWESLYSFFPAKDANGNASNVTSMIKNGSNNLVLSTDKDKLVAVYGLDDYVVVNTDKVMFVCPRDGRKFREFLSNLALPEFEKYR